MSSSLKNVIFSFIQSIDFFNFLLKNHHRRVAVITYHIGKTFGLTPEQLSNAVLAASLHDIGALSVSERDELIRIDIENPHPHARLGSYMLESFDPFSDLSKIIFYHHWSYALDKDYVKEVGPVPIESYIIHLADRVDIAINQTEPILLQLNRIKEIIKERCGTLFHPKVCEAFENVSEINRFWLDIDNMSMRDVLNEIDSSSLDFDLSIELMEQLAFTISKLIDFRSKFTVAHSFGVSELTYRLAQLAGCDEILCKKLRIAGLVHDIGKVGIDIAVLEKAGPLTDSERKHIEEHAYYTNKILFMSKELDEIAEWASHHHENHGGGGYPDNYNDRRISKEMDILAYADIFTALAEKRPYRDGLPLGVILKILKEEFEVKHGSEILNIIMAHQDEIYQTCQSAISDGNTRYNIFESISKKYDEEYHQISKS